MGDQNRFTDLTLSSPFVATGYVESSYNAVWMYVGVIQVNADYELIGGAYGIGAASTESSWTDPEQTTRRTTAKGELLDNWTMQLRHDEDPTKRLVPSDDLAEGHRTLGFVLTERPGGVLTG